MPTLLHHGNSISTLSTASSRIYNLGTVSRNELGETSFSKLTVPTTFPGMNNATTPAELDETRSHLRNVERSRGWNRPIGSFVAYVMTKLNVWASRFNWRVWRWIAAPITISLSWRLVADESGWPWLGSRGLNVAADIDFEFNLMKHNTSVDLPEVLNFHFVKSNYSSRAKRHSNCQKLAQSESLCKS